MNSLACPHCERPMLVANRDGTKLKARTRMVVLHKSGAVEVNCQHCRLGVLLPVSVLSDPLKKADPPRYVLPGIEPIP